MSLEQEFQFYLSHQDELVEQHADKVLVIKGCQVIGVYDSSSEAVTETSKEHEMGTFLVQLCSPGPEAHTAWFHSRAAIV